MDAKRFIKTIHISPHTITVLALFAIFAALFAAFVQLGTANDIADRAYQAVIGALQSIASHF